MIFNCLGCGVSISTNKNRCPYCKADNADCIEMLTGIRRKSEKAELKERMKGTILALVHR